MTTIIPITLNQIFSQKVDIKNYPQTLMKSLDTYLTTDPTLSKTLEVAIKTSPLSWKAPGMSNKIDATKIALLSIDHALRIKYLKEALVTTPDSQTPMPFIDPKNLSFGHWIVYHLHTLLTHLVAFGSSLVTGSPGFALRLFFLTILEALTLILSPIVYPLFKLLAKIDAAELSKKLPN